MAQDMPLDEATVAARLARELPRWQWRDGAIVRRFRTHGWKATLMVVNTIGHIAETAWHHPDLAVSYAKVEVRLSTHSAKGVTEKDFALARKIDEVLGWRPGRDGSPLEGIPADSRHAYLKDDE